MAYQLGTVLSQLINASDNHANRPHTVGALTDDTHAQIARLKKLAAELDAAKAAANDTIAHVASAKHHTDRLITKDTRILDTSPRKRKRLKHR